MYLESILLCRRCKVPKKIRVLAAKPGLDGHDRGIKVICCALRDAGMVMELLKGAGATDILVIGGGIIPEEDIKSLRDVGIRAVFGPGTPTTDIVRFVKETVSR